MVSPTTIETALPPVVKRKLDESRSYGTGVGPGETDKYYVQDGIKFDLDTKEEL
jgi:hypothetical protein